MSLKLSTLDVGRREERTPEKRVGVEGWSTSRWMKEEGCQAGKALGRSGRKVL